MNIYPPPISLLFFCLTLIIILPATTDPPHLHGNISINFTSTCNSAQSKSSSSLPHRSSSTSFERGNTKQQLLAGFEVCKLSNSSDTLLPSNPPESPWTIKTLFSHLDWTKSTVNVLIILLAIVVIFEKDTKEEENKPLDRARRFSLSEIRLATRNFSDQFLIGKGGFGSVYRGMIDSWETTVAVKRLESESNQGEREFLMEIKVLSEVRHNNLISLIGYCNENGEMILVYEYMACGSLADNLFNLSPERSTLFHLSWDQRLNICIGAARGLDYLHATHSVIHCGVNAFNILLDENYLAKVSDFGLAEYCDASHVTTMVKGTVGYLDPHYFLTCRLTRKSDTYSLGVVLLELLCGRRAVDTNLPEDERSLTLWALENIKRGNIDGIVCSSIRDEISEVSLRVFVAIAQRCLRREPTRRPTMARVVLQLESVLKLQNGEPNSGLTISGSVSDDNRDDLSISITMGSMDFQSHEHSLREQTDTRVGDAEVNELQISDIPEANVGVVKFNWETILTATSQFSETSRVGQGGFGSVYRAVLPSGRVVAVKRLSASSRQGHVEFMNEILLLPKLNHRNIIELVGYCIHEEERLIVYEFMENRSLDIHLGDQHLQWELRVKIIMGIARGVIYLHQDCRKTVILRDLKSSNILLDADMNPRISDFALARTLEDHQSELSLSQIAGTPGYMCSEYIRKGICSVKSDVYSFGIVLLEIIVGRRTLERSSSGERAEHLVNIALRLWNQGRALELMNDSIVGTFPVEEAQRCIQVAVSCIQARPSDRPTMFSVLRMLEGIEPVLVASQIDGLDDSNLRGNGIDIDTVVSTCVGLR